jgi:4-carboxymuconolactone decarboxylase
LGRLPPTPREALSPEQLRVNDLIQAGRGRSGGLAGGPFGVWLRDPALTEKAVALYHHLRHDLAAPQRLCELAILVTARAWTAQYEWHAHEKHAVPAGLDAAVVDAIRHRRKPVFSKQDEEIVYELTLELQERRSLSEPTYARAREVLGETLLIELVTLVGFYTMLAILLVGFEVDIPKDAVKIPV